MPVKITPGFGRIDVEHAGTQLHIQRNQDGSVFFLEFYHRPDRVTRNKNLR